MRTNLLLKSCITIQILLFIFIFPSLLFAQAKYVITGHADNHNLPARVFLTYNSGNRVITDSATVINGLFKFTGQVSDVTLATLIMDHNGTGLKSARDNNPDAAIIFLEPGMVTISSGDSIAGARISGTKTNEDYIHYKLVSKPLVEELKALTTEYYAAPADKKNTPKFIDDIQKKQQAIQARTDEMNNLFIKLNPDSYISLQTLIERTNTNNPDAADIQTKFSALSKNLRDSKAGIACQQNINILKSVEIGALAPDFSQPDTIGTPVKLSSFKGKYILIDFWASWCGPCRYENPNIVKAFNKFKTENFTILGISLDDLSRKADWLNAIHKDGLNWNQVSDLKGWNNNVAMQYGVKFIPQNFLIDPSGKIIARNILGNELEKKLSEIFNKI